MTKVIRFDDELLEPYYLFIRENKAVGGTTGCDAEFCKRVLLGSFLLSDFSSVMPSFAKDFSVFAVLYPFPVLGGTTS